MLIRLLLLRLLPVLLLKFYKEKNKIKLSGIILIGWYGILFAAAVLQMFGKLGWKTLIYLPLSMFPHYLCYGFAVWLLVRCVWSAWSARVWRRIYRISVLCVMAGVFMENYWNPQILGFFINFSK